MVENKKREKRGNTPLLLQVIRHGQNHLVPYSLRLQGKVIEVVHQFFKELVAKGFSKNTIRAYAFDLLAFYRFLHEHYLHIKKLTHQQIIDFILAHRR